MVSVHCLCWYVCTCFAAAPKALLPSAEARVYRWVSGLLVPLVFPLFLKWPLLGRLWSQLPGVFIPPQSQTYPQDPVHFPQVQKLIQQHQLVSGLTVCALSSAWLSQLSPWLFPSIYPSQTAADNGMLLTLLSCVNSVVHVVLPSTIYAAHMDSSYPFWQSFPVVLILL